MPDLTGIVKDEGWVRILGKALFWDTVASARGADCASCHFATGANRRIPDQSEAPLQLRRVAADDLREQTSPGLLMDDARDGRVDVCSRRINLPPAEVTDFGPLRPTMLVADEDPSCREDLTLRLAHSLLEHKPLEARTLNPLDGTFGSGGPHGNLISPTGMGLERTYQWMIQQAFEDSLWKPTEGGEPTSEASAASDTDPSARLERNFPLFWSIAVLVYESTLDPNWMRGHEIARSLPVPASSHGEWE
jgi:hypothetical protein